MLPSDGRYALFDNSLADDGDPPSRLLTGYERSILCRREEDIADAFAAIEVALAEGRWVALAAHYELGYWLEPGVLGRRYAPAAPPLLAQVFRDMRTLSRAETDAAIDAALAAFTPEQRIGCAADVRFEVGAEEFTPAVERILRYIRDGDCYQVNYTHAAAFRACGHPLAFYARLRRAQPVRYGACWQTGEGQTIVSLSPELFLRRAGARFAARPMKGTAPRGLLPEEDMAQAETLAQSEKDRAENVMIVDLIRNDLGRIARLGSVRVERLFEVESYPTLFQMTSTVTAQAPGARLLDVFRALFPCGSVTGAPKIRAMQIIAELERAPRGLYCGALGWLAPGGDFLFNVPIRTVVLDDEGRGRMGIGSGIVADSRPAAEFAECRVKARFLARVPPQFQLIESLLLDPADPGAYPLIEDHLARLSASARCFGFYWDAEAVRRALLAHAGALARGGRRKTRLLLHADGRTDIQSSPLPAPTAEPWVTLAGAHTDSRSLFLRHKTSLRTLYEAELKRIAALPGCFDALFCNERGELTEGARSNLYLQRGGRLFTPPASAGLLDGVVRRRLLREGRAEEATLFPQDLGRAEAIYVSNAVRGLVRVRFVPPAQAAADRSPRAPPAPE